MKTNQSNGLVQQVFRQYGKLFFLLVSSFALMGGCKDEEVKEIPADVVTTDVQQAPEVPEWVPAQTSPSIRFYFIPEMSIYYDAFLGHYVYWNGFYWVYTPVLPQGYFYYDLFHANVVFLSVGIGHPWHHHHYYVSHYPVYFFAGADFHHRKHGWRFYNENGGKFYGPHHNIKYQVHYNRHHKNTLDKTKPDFPKTEKNRQHSPGIMKQEKNTRFQENKGGGGKKDQPALKQQPGGKQNVKEVESRKGNYEMKGGSKAKKQMNTRMQQGGGSGTRGGGGKKGGR